MEPQDCISSCLGDHGAWALLIQCPGVLSPEYLVTWVQSTNVLTINTEQKK